MRSISIEVSLGIINLENHEMILEISFEYIFLEFSGNPVFFLTDNSTAYFLLVDNGRWISSQSRILREWSSEIYGSHPVGIYSTVQMVLIILSYKVLILEMYLKTENHGINWSA